MFEHIALIVMYIEELWKVLAKPDDPWELVKKWMTKQNETATDEIREQIRSYKLSKSYKLVL